MHENARQILDIVRGSFSGLSFNGQTDSLDCTMPKTDGEELSCLWSIANSLANDPSRSNGAEQTMALTAVGIERPPATTEC